MSPPRNASAGSVPEPSGAAAPFLQRRGLLTQGSKPWGEVLCLDTEEGCLYLAPTGGTQAFPLDATGPAAFLVADATGLFSVRGTLSGIRQVTVNGVSQRAVRLDFPAGAVERQNRRGTYRVSVQLRGELYPLGPGGVAEALRRSRVDAGRGSRLPHLEGLARSLAAKARPCVVRDLSLGGARLALTSPPPPPGESALLRFAFGDDGVRQDLPCTLLQSRPDTFAAPFDALVRLQFTDLPAPIEGRLGRFISRVQLEDLKKGIRG